MDGTREQCQRGGCLDGALRRRNQARRRGGGIRGPEAAARSGRDGCLTRRRRRRVAPPAELVRGGPDRTMPYARRRRRCLRAHQEGKRQETDEPSCHRILRLGLPFENPESMNSAPAEIEASSA